MPFVDASGVSWNELKWVPFEQVELTTTHYLRQNPWKTDKYPLWSILNYAKKIHIPFAHTQRDAEFFKANKGIYEDNIMNEKSKLMMTLPVGEKIVVLGKQEGYIVELKSEVKAGHINPIYILRDLTRYRGPYVEHSDNEDWIASIKEFVPLVPHEIERLKANLTLTSPNTVLDSFYGLYRDIEVIAKIKTDDWRYVGLPASSGWLHNYFAPDRSGGTSS
jgi:hypothetical protein